ncbi:tryptophan synthase subunit alpha [Geobacter argillaceus]|uniref:Tryptophan synthase alpha chain n=1 Tax=Geobacter argillaceus TaxID=345631 RepID=A0A562WQU6_9BACT|nr:tryptophan synthase subunit alpha [Geobacter argillaceus]TWJ32709.1 tryptophan synthase alpha chain [Geobacter argillaceus]
MSRIGDTFARLGKTGDKALITFITAGDPDLTATAGLIPRMAAAGADIIELGVPFSDPMADGPTIQKASERALAAGATLAGILAMVKEVRNSCQVPLLLMGYYNPIYIYGVERFCRDAVAAGVDGVLVVDLPPEESAELKTVADQAGLDVIFLLTPTSDASRIKTVNRLGRGFIYYVSVTGVTGARTSLADSLSASVTAIRSQVRLPLAVGFGISTPEQAAGVAAVADGVVVGSAIVKLFEERRDGELVERVADMVRVLKDGVRSGQNN